jgi:hypothetical protein
VVRAVMIQLKGNVNRPACARESSSNWTLALARVERAWCRRTPGFFAAPRFDGRDVEAAGGFFNVTRAQKLPGHTRRVAALLPVHGLFGCRPRGLQRSRRRRRLDDAASFYSANPTVEPS